MYFDGDYLRKLPPAPVTFIYEGNEVKGDLGFVPGAAGLVWFLTVDNRHWGQLSYTDRNGWSFTSNTKKLEHLSEYFGSVIVAWVDGQNTADQQ